MDKKAVMDYVNRFHNAHKGLRTTRFFIYDTMKEAFPNASKEELEGITIKGGYYPASNVVKIIAGNINNLKDLGATLKHEVFGHLALNRLSEIDKMDLLTSIAEAPKDSFVGKYRDYLAMTHYPNLKNDPLMLSEEVFAHTAELSFKDIGIFESVPVPKVETKEEILDIVNALKNGIHHGVLEQKIFPKENHLQFSKENKIDRSLLDKTKEFFSQHRQTPQKERGDHSR